MAVNTETMPRRIEINVFMSYNNIGWNSIATDTFAHRRGLRSSTGAQNAEFSLPVVLSAGTWDIEIIHSAGPTVGIYSVLIDNIEIGTFDGYRTATMNNQSSTLSFNRLTTGKKVLTIRMATRNVASSNFLGRINHIVLRRLL